MAERLRIIGNEWRLLNSFKEAIKDLTSTLKETNRQIELLGKKIEKVDS